MTNKQPHKKPLPMIPPKGTVKPKGEANIVTSKSFSRGNEVDENYLRKFYPKPEKDMKWIYSMNINIQGMSIQGELVMEIKDIVEDKVRFSVAMGDQVTEEETSINTFSPVPNLQGGQGNSTGYIFEEKEDLNLPIGLLKDTIKLSTATKEGLSFLWLNEGMGAVKFGINVSGIPAHIELKEFKA